MKKNFYNQFPVGSKVLIDDKINGTVVANITLKQYSSNWSEKDWDYLETGLLIDTDFMGLVYYPYESDLIKLLKD